MKIAMKTNLVSVIMLSVFAATAHPDTSPESNGPKEPAKTPDAWFSHDLNSAGSHITAGKPEEACQAMEVIFNRLMHSEQTFRPKKVHAIVDALGRLGVDYPPAAAFLQSAKEHILTAAIDDACASYRKYTYAYLMLTSRHADLALSFYKSVPDTEPAKVALHERLYPEFMALHDNDELVKFDFPERALTELPATMRAISRDLTAAGDQSPAPDFSAFANKRRDEIALALRAKLDAACALHNRNAAVSALRAAKSLGKPAVDYGQMFDVAAHAFPDLVSVQEPSGQ
jgi:hypothetical protein